ncbi:MAG: RDD family protein [Campylobacterota bacterium]|nr:RDD family protein [Campylobacterota bacterium]
MKKKRFRDIKQGKSIEAKSEEPSVEIKTYYASKGSKIKAFLTDAFMLVMPIMYIVFYLIMGGRDGFAEHKTLGWLYILIPLVVVQTIFMAKTGQTPGYRAYRLTLIDENTGEKPSFFITLFRNLSAVLSLFTFGWLSMFIRKDSKTLHDFLSRTAVIYKIETHANKKPRT